MGANLILLTVVGPTKIRRRQASLLAFADRRFRQLFDLRNAAADRLAVGGVDARGAELRQGDVEVLERFEGHTMTSFRQFVIAFVEFWNRPSARDVSVRYCPKLLPRMKIVSAGERSWGDTPSGYGYKMLESALLFGFFAEFGIH